MATKLCEISSKGCAAADTFKYFKILKFGVFTHGYTCSDFPKFHLAHSTGSQSQFSSWYMSVLDRPRVQEGSCFGISPAFGILLSILNGRHKQSEVLLCFKECGVCEIILPVSYKRYYISNRSYNYPHSLYVSWIILIASDTQQILANWICFRDFLNVTIVERLQSDSILDPIGPVYPRTTTITHFGNHSQVLLPVIASCCPTSDWPFIAAGAAGL